MFRAAVLIAATAGLSGCESGNVAPVTGRVTLDGKPLAGVWVNFYPVATPGHPNPGFPSVSEAPTDADGRYTLVMPQTRRTGAVIGPHVVSVNTFTPPEPEGTSSVKPHSDPLPQRYTTPSELKFDVPPGGAEANFDLVSAPARAPRK